MDRPPTFWAGALRFGQTFQLSDTCSNMKIDLDALTCI